MTLNDKKRLRYATIVNTYADPNLARIGRNWSDQRIYEELGITLPKKTPKIREYKATTVKKKQLEYVRYTSLREVYIEPKKARALSKRSIKGVKESYTRQERVNQWREWSKNDTYPRDLVKRAREINTDVFNLKGSDKYKPTKTGIDDNASYGYMLLYLEFTDNRDINELMRDIEADQSTGLVKSATGSP